MLKFTLKMKNKLLKFDTLSGTHVGFLLESSGFPLKTFMMTPLTCQTRSQKTETEPRYNAAHACTRVAIEQNIRVLKRRFAGLHYGLRSQPARHCRTKVACAVLHNIANQKGNVVVEENEIFFDPIYLAQPGVQGMVRRRVIENYFT